MKTKQRASLPLLLPARVVFTLLCFSIIACKSEKTSEQDAGSADVVMDTTALLAKTPIQALAPDTISRVPTSPAPATPEWRLGFAAAEKVFFIELLPSNQEICDERDELVSTVTASLELHEGAVALPFEKATLLQNVSIVNPQEWTVVDVQGKVWRESFAKLATFFGEGNYGGYYLASESFRGEEQSIEWPSDQNLIFAIANAPAHPPKVRLPLSSIPTGEYGSPIEDPDFLPSDYRNILNLPEVLATLGDRLDTLNVRSALVFGNSIQALIDEEAKTLWLLNYDWSEDSTSLAEGCKLWGIFRIAGSAFAPLFLSKFVCLNVDAYDLYYLNFAFLHCSLISALAKV